ncbi:FecR domain-containing protein [uncultured Sphingomonas sp.]|uniref:FecR family protein n=1 Tax=uncultured Sphingomonas sp. TaxID=158754 RepID=UPI0025F54139|nr:FecR domain-containing protein [uncultured Sphingomonas sp.]
MSPATDVVDLAAAAWVERLARPLHNAEMLARFDTWIEADPRHAERYGALQAVWTAPELAEALREKTTVEAPPTRNPRRFALAGALAACLAAGVWLMPGFAHQHVVVPAGQMRRLALEDGSRVVLAGNSELDVRMTPWHRSADLVRGEAFFDVAHRRFRPFSVAAGQAEARVLGTAFDVQHQADGVTALHVYRGAVSFGRSDRTGQVIRAGQAAQWTATGLKRLAGTTTNAPEWLGGWLDVDNEPLKQVVAQLNRFSAKPIVLATSDLGTQRTSGRFDLRDPARALDGLALGMGLTWRDTGERYVVTPAKDQR